MKLSSVVCPLCSFLTELRDLCVPPPTLSAAAATRLHAAATSGSEWMCIAQTTSTLLVLACISNRITSLLAAPDPSLRFERVGQLADSALLAHSQLVVLRQPLLILHREKV